jgi:hypothetical protein
MGVIFEGRKNVHYFDVEIGKYDMKNYDSERSGSG